MFRFRVCVIACALTFASSVAQADIITVPIGLSPGAKYYLAFVTSGTRDAASSVIADYDLFVNEQADLSSSAAVRDITWRALGSTATVSAKDHLALGEFPIYLLDGTTRIATGGEDLWDGSIENPLALNQEATDVGIVGVWTGSDLFGSRLREFASADPLGRTTLGFSDRDDFGWIAAGDLPFEDWAFSLYGFSELLTVPVPEPASLTIWAVFSGCAVVCHRIRRRQSLRKSSAQ